MLRYPRIEVIKRIIYVPIYRESYEVQTMCPNRPMQSKFGMSKTQANAYSKRMLALLKKEGYEKAVFNSSMVDLRKFVFMKFYALPYDYMGGVFFGGGLSPHTPCSFIFHIYLFLDRTYPTSSCVAFTFRRCLCRRKRCLKRYGRDLNSHSPLFYLDLLPFSYITLYTYTPIDVF